MSNFIDESKITQFYVHIPSFHINGVTYNVINGGLRFRRLPIITVSKRLHLPGPIEQQAITLRKVCGKASFPCADPLLLEANRELLVDFIALEADPKVFRLQNGVEDESPLRVYGNAKEFTVYYKYIQIIAEQNTPLRNPCLDYQ